MSRSLLAAVALGQVIGLLAWVEPLFVPLVLAGPPISGAIAASRSLAYRWIALAWAAAGLNMLVVDWVVNNEDQLFHAALAVVMPLLAGIGWGTVRFAARRSPRPV